MRSVDRDPQTAPTLAHSEPFAISSDVLCHAGYSYSNKMSEAFARTINIFLLMNVGILKQSVRDTMCLHFQNNRTRGGRQGDLSSGQAQHHRAIALVYGAGQEITSGTKWEEEACAGFEWHERCRNCHSQTAKAMRQRQRWSPRTEKHVKLKYGALCSLCMADCGFYLRVSLPATVSYLSLWNLK